MATAEVGGQGVDYARRVGVLVLRVRKGEVEMLEYEGRVGCDLWMRAICLLLALRVLLDIVADWLGPYVESMDTRWALKVRERLVGHVGWRLGSEWSLRLAFHVVGDLGVGSGDARMASGKETTPGRLLWCRRRVHV